MTQRICNQGSVREPARGNMKRTGAVVAITLLTMIAEIVYGLITGSMALLADGIHMGTHTFALIVTLLAYLIAQKHAGNPDFAFSSGKVSVLGAYTNAIILGITAVYMVNEAIHRLINPEEIHFDQALIVAVIGLFINILSAVLLSAGGRHHSHGEDDDHHHDHNLRSAYLHVITDAMTSVLAILALLSGKILNLLWPDALVAILGAAVILKWAFDLLVSSGKLLADYYPASRESEKVQSIADSFNVTITDLHICKPSENEKAMVLHLSAAGEVDKSLFQEQLQTVCSCSHISIDIDQA